jgi:hypothetical protein
LAVKGSVYAAFIRTILACIFTTVTSIIAALGGVIRRIGITPAIADPFWDIDNTAREIRVLLG